MPPKFALFAIYPRQILLDLFGEESYFTADVDTAIARRQAGYLDAGRSDVVVMEANHCSISGSTRRTMPKTKGGTARLQLGSYHLPSHLRFLGFFQWKGAPRAGHTSIQASAAFNIRSLGLNPGSICPRIIALRNSEPPRRG